VDRFPTKFKLTRVDVHAALAREDVVCPGCGYSLRGLSGDIVTCPECGRRCDVASMIHRAWTLPWYTAPDFNLVALPSVWPVGGCIAWMFWNGYYDEVLEPNGHLVSWAIGAVALAGWLWAMRRVWREWPGIAGARLAIFALVIVAGLFSVIIGFFACMLFFVLALTHGNQIAAIACVLAPAVLSGLFSLCYRGQRSIAERCIRRYLSRVPPLADQTANPVEPPVA